MFTCLDLSFSVLSRAPSPICLGSVSLSPYKVARHKSPREPWTAPNNTSLETETQRSFQVTLLECDRFYGVWIARV